MADTPEFYDAQYGYIQGEPMRDPIRVAVTGAAGNIGYALLFRIASGNCFGDDQPVILQLLEIPPAMGALEGVVMELQDAAFPLVHGIEISDDANVAFKDADAAFLVGSRPRSKDMDRADLIKVNGPIFTGQGKALNDNAKTSVKVLVVGNPCNTSADCMPLAPDIPNAQFHAMTRLDENRGKAQITNKLGVTAGEVKNPSGATTPTPCSRTSTTPRAALMSSARSARSGVKATSCRPCRRGKAIDGARCLQCCVTSVRCGRPPSGGSVHRRRAHLDGSVVIGRVQRPGGLPRSL